MKLKLIVIFTLLIFYVNFVNAQEAFTIKKAPFSSDLYDEFAPVYYKSGIVFCSNRSAGSMVSYSGADNKAQFKIFYSDTAGNVKWQKAELLSKSLSSRMNDGPVTFSRGFDTIYYSRNNRVEGNYRELTGMGNKLGIFSSVTDGKKWITPKEFRFNNEFYNITTPCLSPDGKRIYYASDKPGGLGGSDIYYCAWRNGYWDEPVNLGPAINTSGNESYPFLNEAGELFFASDGHPGLGGKDIFVTKQKGSAWYAPVRLEAPVNSEFDDFGIVTDPLSNEGFFSSERDKTIDIYQFRTEFFQFWFAEVQKENEYCLTISDTGAVQADTMRFQYIWDFGDGSKLKGKTVSHCFGGNGRYTINLDLIDKKSGNLFFRKLSYDIEIFNIDQPFINSPDLSVLGEDISFDGLNSYCPGFEITGYYFDFGDGENAAGEKVSHKYSKAGVYDVRMGLTLRSESSGKTIKRVVTRKIRILNSVQEKASYLVKTPELKQNLTDIRQIENMKVNRLYSAEVDFLKESMFQVVVLTSRSKTNMTNGAFKNLPSKYTVKEIFEPDLGQYSYVVDQQMTLMTAYPAYNDVVNAGFRNAFVRIYLLKDQAEKDLYNIRKNFDLLADNNFDASNRMLTNAYILLDQIVSLMNKYPTIKLEVGVHTDNQGIPANNQMISQFRAQVLVNHLISRGVSASRLTAKGYGAVRPINSNITQNERRSNRRVDFSLNN